jgi:hypothetical protein
MKELSQGEYDALLTATFQGALLFKWFELSKQALKEEVVKKTKIFGGATRLNLFNQLWMNQPLNCKAKIQSSKDMEKKCFNCGVSKDICEAASNPDPNVCYPNQEPSIAPTKKPTKEPSKAPSKDPTKERTKTPTREPTKSPTAIPTTLAPKLPMTPPPEGLTQPPLPAPSAPPIQECDQIVERCYYCNPESTLKQECLLVQQEPDSYVGWTLITEIVCWYPYTGGLFCFIEECPNTPLCPWI